MISAACCIRVPGVSSLSSLKSTTGCSHYCMKFRLWCSVRSDLNNLAFRLDLSFVASDLGLLGVEAYDSQSSTGPDGQLVVLEQDLVSESQASGRGQLERRNDLLPGARIAMTFAGGVKMTNAAMAARWACSKPSVAYSRSGTAAIILEKQKTLATRTFAFSTVLCYLLPCTSYPGSSRADILWA
jgi:hypothetical protein